MGDTLWAGVEGPESGGVGTLETMGQATTPRHDSHVDERTVALILAGGRGGRLAPLTDHRPKPAVPLAGHYRLIDVPLSNLVNSGIRDVWIVEQYLPGLLNKHLAAGRPWDLDGTRHGLRILPPSQGDVADGFSRGNGHALYQQLSALENEDVDTVVVLSADHVYHLDVSEVLAAHRRRGSDLTVVTTRIDGDPSRFGVVESDGDERVTAYSYKPEDPAGDVVATEVFVFDVAALRAACTALTEGGSAQDSDGTELGDYGETIVPYLVDHAVAHEFRMTGYWRDLGTIDSFFQAHMDLIDRVGIDLGRVDWPMITNLSQSSPARIDARATVTDCLISPGAVVAGEVEHSIIGPGVVVEHGASVRRSVLLGAVTVPAGADLESVIADHGAEIPAETVGRTKPGPGNITVLVDESAPGGADGLI